MSSAKSTFEEKLIKDCAYSNSNKLFDYIRGLSNTSSIPHTVYFENQSAATDIDKASMFNTYFHSVMTRSDFALPSPCDLPVSDSSLVNITILDSEVYDTLISLDETKAMGIDGIPPIILKHCALALYKPFHQLFLLRLKQGCLSSEWKVHRITPVPKSGDLTSVKNYRPITLLCTISKVLERLVYNKVIVFLSRCLYSKQFGFIKNSSCLQNLLLFFTNIYHSHDINMQTDVIYTDFRKTFDSVSHNELLFKLKSTGIGGSLWHWFCGYLSSRVQCVSINNSLSPFLPVTSGVPQGSILGPILFLIYINDLPLSIKFSNLFLFADDGKCALPIGGYPDQTHLQSDINSLYEWSCTWHLSFNKGKFTLIRFFANIETTYTIEDTPITLRSSHKDLGVIISNDLKWNDHIHYILSKAYRMLHLLRRTFYAVKAVNPKKILYLSLIRSKVTYCSPIWRPNFIKDIKLLEDLQRRATKFILNVKLQISSNSS